MTVQIEGPTKTFEAAAALGKYTLVRLNGSSEIALNGAANADSLGVLTREVLADGDDAAVRLWTAEGTHKVVASGAISADATVYAAASGKVASSGTVVIGQAINAATANNDIIEILRKPAAVGVSRASIEQENLAEYAIPFDTLVKWDDWTANLPGAAGTDDLGVIEGTIGTDAPQIEGLDSGGTTVLGYMRFQFPVPVEYVNGQTINVEVRALMKVVSDDVAAVDLVCYRQAAKTVDINPTAAISINSATAANKTFVLTPTNVVSGDLLDIRISLGATDAGNAADFITPVIEHVKMLLDIKG